MGPAKESKRELKKSKMADDGQQPNLANLEGLRARSSLRPGEIGYYDDDHHDNAYFRPWRRRFLSSVMAVKLTWSSAFRFSLLLLLIAAIATAFISLPVEKLLKDFLIWVKEDLGPWGPLVLAIAYIPLTVLAVPASVLTLGGGYLFGLPVGFIADSIGATIGATAAFILGRTIGRSYVISKLKNYPKFQAVAIATDRSVSSGVSYSLIVLLLRLVPLLPFNMLNYLLSVTSVHIGEYMLASWFGMMPITFGLVYVGTTLKDLSDVTHGWNELSTTRLVFIALGFGISDLLSFYATVILMVCITKVAKNSLEKALAENAEIESIISPSMLPIVADSPSDLHKPLIVSIDSLEDDHEK
ncbi:hypothetical protein FEM48_Zijuj09G0036600 [Ziziphus jujuba var. spinosa]|uniref:VTT domain-containing protein n=1 Tax=Ziziphus jujuba var. spinosa TaxID=714518 RepID=A0A978UQP3_ZIZJJ|nr:hypothetical protein FEM48_Zijuj09G0036600 [Ziziphus jujuba var. spinosa]